MHTEFDSKTAQPLAKRIGGLPHAAYRDDNGAICVWSWSRLDGGGVAVNAVAVGRDEALF